MTCMANPPVGIVVLNFNGTDDTVECVESLCRVTYPQARIYVVDNGSKESPRAKLAPFLNRMVLIENGENLGFTGGNNVGCRRALEDGMKYVLLLNNDTVVDPGFLEPMVAAMEGDPALGMVTPKIYFYGRDKEFWAYGARIERWTGRSPHIGVYETDRGQYDSIRDVARITGCAMFVRRELFERVGFLDDRFFIYCEETDWCLRSRAAGYRLEVVPSSVIWHKGHRDSGRVGKPFIAYLQTRNQLFLLRKNSRHFALRGIPALGWYSASLLWAVVRHLGYALFQFRRDALACAGAYLRGVTACLGGRFGRPPY